MSYGRLGAGGFGGDLGKRGGVPGFGGLPAGCGGSFTLGNLIFGNFGGGGGGGNCALAVYDIKVTAATISILNAFIKN